MNKTEYPKHKFQCSNCGREIDIDANAVWDENAPELSVTDEGWFVLFPPRDWVIEFDYRTFCSLGCLDLWVEKAKEW